MNKEEGTHFSYAIHLYLLCYSAQAWLMLIMEIQSILFYFFNGSFSIWTYSPFQKRLDFYHIQEYIYRKESYLGMIKQLDLLLLMDSTN